MRVKKLRWARAFQLLFGAALMMAMIYVGMLVSDMQGRAGDPTQDAPEGYCTRVVVTPQSTWLLERRETFGPAELPETASHTDLMALLPPITQRNSAAGERRKAFRWLLSKQNSRGEFEPVAAVSEAACLRATPDGKRVFLLTRLHRPASHRLNPAVVFQSRDQGRTWQWLREGLFAQAAMDAWKFDAHFFDTRWFWAWGTEKPGYALEREPLPEDASGLLYSNDGGSSFESVQAAEGWLLSLQKVANYLAPVQYLKKTDIRDTVIRRHVWQLDADRTLVWVTQHFSVASREDAAGEFSGNFLISSLIELRRSQGGGWQMAQMQRMEDVVVERILASRAGVVMAAITQAGERDAALMEVNTDTFQWALRGTMPAALGPFNTRRTLREQPFVAGEILVLGSSSQRHAAAWTSPLHPRPAEISARGIYRSSDRGRSWTRLSMPGNLALLGFDPADPPGFWSPGSW